MKVKLMQVGPIGTNCYLLCDTGACAVIDPGAEAPRVAAAVRESGCTPCAILLTHGHYDHTDAERSCSRRRSVTDAACPLRVLIGPSPPHGSLLEDPRDCHGSRARKERAPGIPRDMMRGKSPSAPNACGHSGAQL